MEIFNEDYFKKSPEVIKFFKQFPIDPVNKIWKNLDK